MDKGGFGGEYFLQQYSGLKDGSYDDGMGGTVRVTGGKAVHYPKSGTVPENVQAGGKGGKYDTDTTITEESGSGGSEVRVSPTQVVQKGKTLGGINNFLKGMGLRSLTDLKDEYGTPEREKGEVPTNMDGTAPEKNFFEGLPGLTQTPSNTATTATTPETTSNPSDEQDGASEKPTLADNIRTVRIARGARQQEFAERPGNRPERKDPDTSSLVSPMYANETRNRIRNAFLDMSKGPVRASMDASAQARRYRDVIGGETYFNYGGKAVKAKEGMERQASNAAMMGENPLQYLDINADSPTDTQLTPDQARAAGQAFAQDRIERMKKQNKQNYLQQLQVYAVDQCPQNIFKPVQMYNVQLQLVYLPAMTLVNGTTMVQNR